MGPSEVADRESGHGTRRSSERLAPVDGLGTSVAERSRGSEHGSRRRLDLSKRLGDLDHSKRSTGNTMGRISTPISDDLLGTSDDLRLDGDGAHPDR